MWGDAVTGLAKTPDFAVARYVPGTGDVHYLKSGEDVTTTVTTGLTTPLEPGTYQLGLEQPADVELTISARGQVFDLFAQTDLCAAHGLGIVDPEFTDSLLVSWWSGDARPAGIVKYVIDDEPDTIIPTYTSVMLEASGFNDVLRGRATGNTKDGFPGTYVITYEAEGGASFGPFDWTITPRGDVFDLAWDMGGRRIIDGFGFADPDSDRSIVVVYWGTGSTQ
jgi:hypothetical protein